MIYPIASKKFKHFRRYIHLCENTLTFLICVLYTHRQRKGKKEIEKGREREC